MVVVGVVIDESIIRKQADDKISKRGFRDFLNKSLQLAEGVIIIPLSFNTLLRYGTILLSYKVFHEIPPFKIWQFHF